MQLDIEKLRSETPGVAERIHLLASGSALMPQPVINAVIEHTLLEARIGGYEAQAAQSAMLEGIYDTVAAHLGAKAREIALLESATAAWCHAFYALPLKAGSRLRGDAASR